MHRYRRPNGANPHPRSVRVPDALWAAAKTRAAAEDLTVSKALFFLICGYVDGAYTPTATDELVGGPTSERAIRVPVNLWETARAKSEADGANISQTLRALLVGYVNGEYRMPQELLVYP